MNYEYELRLIDNGDICIFENNVEIYHKSYNIGENLLENLFHVYQIWDNYKTKECMKITLFRNDN